MIVVMNDDPLVQAQLWATGNNTASASRAVIVLKRRNTTLMKPSVFKKPAAVVAGSR